MILHYEFQFLPINHRIGTDIQLGDLHSDDLQQAGYVMQQVPAEALVRYECRYHNILHSN